MKYLAIVRPRMDVEMQDPLALTKAGKAYFQHLKDEGKAESIYQFVDKGGSMAIINALTLEEVEQILKESPGYRYGEIELHALQDGMEAFDEMIRQLEQMQKQAV